VPPSGYRRGPPVRANVSAAIVSPTAAVVKLDGCLASAARRSPLVYAGSGLRGGRFKAGGNGAVVPRFFQALAQEEEVIQLVQLQEARHLAAGPRDHPEPSLAPPQHVARLYQQLHVVEPDYPRGPQVQDQAAAVRPL